MISFFLFLSFFPGKEKKNSSTLLENKEKMMMEEGKETRIDMFSIRAESRRRLTKLF